MRRLLSLSVCLVAMTACARLPRIDPYPAGQLSTAASACRDLFPSGHWQLLHSIVATLPGGRTHILTGVTVLSSEERSIQWALMTVEGFILFSGRWDGMLTVDRAVPPFDRPGFAEGVIEDLRMLFFAPRDPLTAAGRLERGEPVCRFGSVENTTDIAMRSDASRIVRQYAPNHKLVRSVVADAPSHAARGGFAGHLILKHHGMIGYQLELKLMEAISLDEEHKQ